MMEPGRHVGQLDEVAKVLDAGIAPAFIEAAYEGRSVGGREDRVGAADDDVVRGIARVLRELPRRRRLDQRSAHPAWKAHPFLAHVGARLPEQLQRLRVVAEVDADLLEDRVGVVFEQFQAVVTEHLVVRNLARDVGHEVVRPCGARGALGIASARAAAARDGSVRLVHKRALLAPVATVWWRGRPAD